jgi:hypothetical protein
MNWTRNTKNELMYGVGSYSTRWGRHNSRVAYGPAIEVYRRYFDDLRTKRMEGRTVPKRATTLTYAEAMERLKARPKIAN